MNGIFRSRRFFSLLAVLLFFSFNLFSEETALPDDTALPEEAGTGIDSEKTPEAGEKSITFNAINFLRDILYDKYPFRVDFGAEPHRHGSMVFGSVDYDWSDSFSQRFRLEYDHYLISTNSSGKLSNQEVRSVSLTPFPVVFYFGDGDIKSKERFTQFNIGLYFNYSITTTDSGSFFSLSEDDDVWEKIGLDDSSDQSVSGFLINNAEQKYTIIGPAFGYSLNIPIHKYISATIEGFIVPAYIVNLTTESETTYHVSGEYGVQKAPKSSVDFRSLSYPIARQTLALDFFRYIRIKANMTYQHLDLRAINIEDTEVESYSQHTITLRYGGELIKPANTRKKSSHLWAGLYYEMSWVKSYIQDVYSSEYNGKWVLCFGT